MVDGPNVQHGCVQRNYPCRMNFGKRVESLRKSKEWSQEHFGKLIGVSRQAIAKLESGDSKSMQVENALKAAKLFGITVDEFVTGRAVRGAKATPEDDDYSTLPQLDFAGAMGPGVLNNDYVEVKGGLKFKRTFLVDEKIPEDRGQVVYAKGESMSPTIPDGSVVLINRAETTPRHGKVYLVIDRDEGARIKRLKRDRDGWLIGCDNEDKASHPDEPFDEERHTIAGRAAWFGSRL